jgi:hypothetical protein
LLERVDREAFGAGSPGLANELVGREPLEGFEPAAEVVGGDEVGEMLAELVMALVVEAPDRCVLAASDDSTVGRSLLVAGSLAHACLLPSHEHELATERLEVLHNGTRWNSSRAPVRPRRRMRSKAMLDFQMCKAHLYFLSRIARTLELGCAL